MPNHTRGHHYFRRKNKKDGFDYIVYFFMIATPMFELPQLYNIYATKNSIGVSLWTWGFFLLSSIVWSIYALRNKLFPIIASNVLYFAIEVAIVAGIFIYPQHQ